MTKLIREENMNFVKKALTWSFPVAEKQMGDYSRREGIAFLVGMLGQNMIYNIIGAALSVFYTDVVMIDIAVVGIILTACRVWDALNDPVMGVIMENTRSRWGKCRPYLKYMPLPVAVITLLLFMPISDWPMGAKITYLVMIYFLWSPIYTLCDIPLWSLPSRMVPDEGKRTKLISAARVVGNLGAVVTALYAPMKNFIGGLDLGIFANEGLANHSGYFSQEQGYLFTTLIIVVIGMILFKVTFPFVRERVDLPNAQTSNVKDILKTVKSNAPFVRVFISGILGCTKTLLLTAGMYFCKWVMGDGNEGLWLIYLGAPFMVGYILSMVITPAMGTKFTKKRLYLWTSYLSAVPMLVMFFAAFQNLTLLHEPGYLALMIIMLALYGFFSGFTIALQPVMIADSVDYIEWKAGKRNDGIFFSGLTFNSKLSAGIAILISNLLLGFVSYTPVIDSLSKQIEAAADSGQTFTLNFAAEYPEITMMMFILITIVPAIGCILQAIPMHRYELTDAKLAEIRAINEERRAACTANGEILEEVITENNETSENADADASETSDAEQNEENVVNVDESIVTPEQAESEQTDDNSDEN